jgi:hypothetical protein
MSYVASIGSKVRERGGMVTTTTPLVSSGPGRFTTL